MLDAGFRLIASFVASGPTGNKTLYSLARYPPTKELRANPLFQGAPLLAFEKWPGNFGNIFAVTDVTFSSQPFMVMIPLVPHSESGAYMDRRKERRLDLELPVRVWGVDRMAKPFAEMVRVRNVSNHGAVLVGMRSKIQTGDLLDVQHGSSYTQFRIVWMNPAGEAGIEALSFEPPILGLGLPEVFDMVGSG